MQSRTKFGQKRVRRVMGYEKTREYFLFVTSRDFLPSNRFVCFRTKSLCENIYMWISSTKWKFYLLTVRSFWYVVEILLINCTFSLICVKRRKNKIVFVINVDSVTINSTGQKLSFWVSDIDTIRHEKIPFFCNESIRRIFKRSEGWRNFQMVRNSFIEFQ